jgi:Cys-rich repeat protein
MVTTCASNTDCPSGNTCFTYGDAGSGFCIPAFDAGGAMPDGSASLDGSASHDGGAADATGD